MLEAEESWVASTMTELNIIRVTHPAEVLALTENILLSHTGHTGKLFRARGGMMSLYVDMLWVFCSEN